ncbi:InlB B-repeat-containing protein [Mesobacillus foraminis]|uniref:Putative repeat protein (TIGR02543 family) n=2 Tax=Mesobacillus foraminis TaxID=279826 RepID=A0A4V2RCW8_9BACI|nr:InlB B-repeat-containing protein [Mesobacillus foraminis]TCN22570.1 putative repeat protein (TIGR02543 family) [Mesobacillus foraminis]
MVVKRAVSMLIGVLLVLNMFLGIAFAAEDDDAASPAGTRVETEKFTQLETAKMELQNKVTTLEKAKSANATTVAQLQSKLAAVKALADGLETAQGASAEEIVAVQAAREEASTALEAANDLIGNLTGAASEEDLLVTFDTAGGSAVEPQRVSAGDAIEVPERPKKDGLVFVGWYTDEAASVHMWDFLNNTVVRSMTLYAKWIKVDEKHRLLNAYASAEELESPYVAKTLQTLGTLSENKRELTLPEGTTVYIVPGVYWTDETYKEGGVIGGPNIGLSILGENISFLGLTEDATDAIICGNRGEGGENGLGANGSWYSLGISSGFHSENITIANYAQEDLVYPRDPSQNIKKRLDSKNHAEVLTRANGTGAPDKLYFENTRFVGYLNMMVGLAPTRAYFLDSFFQLTDDSIFSGGVNVYENCTFHFFGNHPSVNGADNGGVNVLLGSKIIGMPQMTSTDVYLAKQSNAIGPNANGIFALIDTQFTGRIESVEWENVVREDARHFVSNNTIGEGKTPLVISPSQPQTSVTLTGDALNAFKVGEEYNVYNLLKGNDGWDPKGQFNAEWEPYANLPYRFLVDAKGKTMYSDKADSTNRAVLTPAPAPADSVDVKNTVWSYDTNLLNGTVDAATGVITLTAKPNNTGAIVKTIVTGTLPSGISAGATLYIRPTPVPAPVVTGPAIDISENLATLSYTLDQLGYKDTSVIEWYRETGPDTTNGVHIGTMHNDANEFFIDEPYKNYSLNKYDVGYYLRAVIKPKYEFSSASAPITVYTKRPVTAKDVTETSLYTDFKNLYFTNEDNTTTKGRWFFDRVSGTAVPWGWGIGTNGTDKIWGLQNNSGGTNTRFVFGQTGSYRDMSLNLNYSSSKVEGQGFGGNGHFMDIYVKYDPATRTGYGLRVERTAAGGSNATIWTLYKYDGTNQIPLSEPIRTAAFMPKSTITVSVTGSTLRVQASTLSEKTPLQTQQNLPNSVDISWTDETGALGDNLFGGFGIRINNSGNSSYDYAGSGMTTNNTVMLHNVRVDASERSTKNDNIVTFDTNGGSEIASLVVAEGGKIEQPEDPTKAGFMFDGWFSDAKLETPWNFDMPVTTDMTLYAKWKEIVVLKATPSASVEKLSGNKNNLTIKISEELSDGNTNVISETFSISNNAAGTYKVGTYQVYVDTKGNTQIRECYIVE